MSVLTRPARSPRTPKQMPPIAQPSMKIEVATVPAILTASLLYEPAAVFRDGAGLRSSAAIAVIAAR